ncbi:hypothetical protein BK131_27335 [Paenibacillus amylolyticus]|uniref:Uncharacterized protein n=1 Tax=Paenibacillus amylolyticus TaxID=1451 RepID=A0A1R1BGZ3_PAEAM|nr:hypothetical protein BK131_27335 [Paenibacillus amylolyticus]
MSEPYRHISLEFQKKAGTSFSEMTEREYLLFFLLKVQLNITHNGEDRNILKKWNVRLKAF